MIATEMFIKEQSVAERDATKV